MAKVQQITTLKDFQRWLETAPETDIVAMACRDPWSCPLAIYLQRNSDLPNTANVGFYSYKDAQEVLHDLPLWAEVFVNQVTSMGMTFLPRDAALQVLKEIDNGTL